MRHVPIFVGGTGLYFRALAEGLSEMPDIPEGIRNRWRYELNEQGSHKLHRLLTQEDPQTAATLRPSDGQRIIRALEVLESSGRSIRDWQSVQGQPLIDQATANMFVVVPEREELARRIEIRFDQMIGLGAREEVQQLMRLGLDATLPAMKAIGVRELSAASSGKTEDGDAILRAKIATRQYAKRQMTWFRNQFGPKWTRIHTVSTVFEGTFAQRSASGLPSVVQLLRSLPQR